MVTTVNCPKCRFSINLNQLLMDPGWNPTTWKYAKDNFGRKFQVKRVGKDWIIRCPKCGHEWIIQGLIYKPNQKTKTNLRIKQGL